MRLVRNLTLVTAANNHHRTKHAKRYIGDERKKEEKRRTEMDQILLVDGNGLRSGL